MKHLALRTVFAAGLMAVMLMASSLSAAEPQTSPRMEKAKDYIAEEQWIRAIDVLKAAAADPKERNRDEALFWLAHSQHQSGDLAAALDSIVDLERKFPKSRWVKLAGSIRVEVAQKMRRDDVLWFTARRPAPTPSPAVVGPNVRAPAPLPAGAATTATARPPRPIEGTAPAPPAPATAPPRGAAGAGGRVRPVTPTELPRVWVSEFSANDTNLRIMALGSLIKTDAPRVIPMLREIALESENPNEARRAVFVLAQSGRPEAHATVLEVARRAPEPVSAAAVRELGRFGGPSISKDLLELYETVNPRVKYQVVYSLGERSAATALHQIVESEADPFLRNTAIATLGRAGGRQHLQRLYRRANAQLKRPIILGLFNARADEELIRIVQAEKDAAIVREIHTRLRLLGTPKAKEYLEKVNARR